MTQKSSRCINEQCHFYDLAVDVERHNHLYYCKLEGCNYYGDAVTADHVHTAMFKGIQITEEGVTFGMPKGSEAQNSYRVPLNVRYDLIPPLILRELAEIYEEGAQKYGQQKYVEKPLPFSSLVNHMFEHLIKYCSGDRSEKHLAKIMWGAATMRTLDELAENRLIKDMNDLSEYGALFNQALEKSNE